jgi:hypothetical protein
VISVGLMPLSAKAALRSRTRTSDAMLSTLRLNSIAGRCRGRDGQRFSVFVTFPVAFFEKKRSQNYYKICVIITVMWSSGNVNSNVECLCLMLLNDTDSTACIR